MKKPTTKLISVAIDLPPELAEEVLSLAARADVPPEHVVRLLLVMSLPKPGVKE